MVDTSQLQAEVQKQFNRGEEYAMAVRQHTARRTGRSNTPFKQELINHIAIVVDGSSSMHRHKDAVIQVVDGQTKYLARRSQEMGQETRVSVYVFADKVECLIFDTDVLRLPSIASLYEPYGNTALLDATIRSQEELAETAQRHGEHSFLTFVITDGEENASRDEYGRRVHPSVLNQLITGQPDHWTVAALVPNVMAKRDAITYGFPKENVSVWDTTSAQGMEEVGQVINTATESFLRGRASGVRGSRSIFSTGEDAVNSQTVQAAGLEPLPASKYHLIPVPEDGVEIRPFVEAAGINYKIGTVFYELSKDLVTIQGTKKIAVVERTTDKVFWDPQDNGPRARALVGLSDTNERRRADKNTKYSTFVQSTSVNRKLKVGTRVLVLV